MSKGDRSFKKNKIKYHQQSSKFKYKRPKQIFIQKFGVGTI